MEYNEIPKLLRQLQSNLSDIELQISLIEVKLPIITLINIGLVNRTVEVSAAGLLGLLQNRKHELLKEIEHYKSVHETISKVATGLLK